MRLERKAGEVQGREPRGPGRMHTRDGLLSYRRNGSAFLSDNNYATRGQLDVGTG